MNVVNSAKRAGSVDGVCTEVCPFTPRTPSAAKSCSGAHPRSRTVPSHRGDVAGPRHFDVAQTLAYTWIHEGLPSGGALEVRTNRGGNPWTPHLPFIARAC